MNRPPRQVAVWISAVGLAMATSAGVEPAAAGPKGMAAVRHSPLKKGPRVTPVRRGQSGKGPSRTTTLPRVATGGAAHEHKIAVLREQLEAALHESPLAGTRIGVVAMQASDGDVLFSHNADERFNPASNTKMLTTAAAISRLGGDYRYLCGLYGTPPDLNGVVSGNLVLRGSADPSLSSADLVELAEALAARGITRVRGDLVVDRRPIGFEGQSDAGLILNRNAIAVRVRPTEPKHAPAVSMEPATAGITIENHATTIKGKKSRLSIDTYRNDDHLVIQVRGRIGDGHGTVTLSKRVADGALLAAHTLGALLPEFGIVVEGRVRAGQEHAGAVELALHRSAPLADVSRLSNKPSNNFVADAIYKTLGGELFGLPGTLEKGTRAVSEWLVEHGISKERFKLVNGSGLTHENRVTPIDLTRLLRAIYFEPEVAPDFLPSLAVAGIDGTIRNRFHGTPAVGLVRAKTGTLSGVSALSGYVGDKGDVIVFSILVEGFRWKRTPAIRHAQVRLVEAMLRYLRADALGESQDANPRPNPDALHEDGIVAPPPPPIIATPPMEDSEDSEADDPAN